MADWTIEYKRRVREFMEKKASKVLFEADRFSEPDSVSIYGWNDWRAAMHISSGCCWIVPQGARLYERSYSQFDGTFTDNKIQVGINVSGCRCKCGEYKDITLRYEGGLADVMREITGVPVRAEVEL